MSGNMVPAKKNTNSGLPLALRLLMCAPEYFEVSYEINQWMQPQTWKDNSNQFKQIANEQWQHLYQTFEFIGVAVELVKPEPGVPDMVFTANAAIVLDDGCF